MRNVLAILGIHTGIGKTIASAVLVEALHADYWKPIQAGDLENSDSKKVSSWLSNQASRVHPEAFRLTKPLSPHEAAAHDGVKVEIETLSWPETDNFLVVETAGGVLSPVNAHATVADFVSHYHLPSILVVRHYLGSINHTLASMEVIRARKIKLLGIVVSGTPNAASQSFIEGYSGIKFLTTIPEMPTVTRTSIQEAASVIHGDLKPLNHEHA
jgi:dethiobiotin synthetase